jgi:GT2 family glycosyltransferase
LKGNDICVVVCTYNRENTLRTALESLIHQKSNGEFTFDILVIDDASTDGTRNVVQQIALHSDIIIKYVAADGKGIASARNKGVKEAESRWIAFFDDDQIAEPYWLDELYRCAMETGALFAGGVRSLDLSSENILNLSTTCRRLLGETYYGPKKKKCNRKEFPSTGNVLINRNAFEKIGYFDESLIYGGSDDDFFSRAWLAGSEFWYNPNAVVYHTIPHHRLKEDHLLWCSLRVGSGFANTDYVEGGIKKTMAACFARIGQALFVNIPLFASAFLTGSGAEKLGRKCLIWRAVGYARKTLFLISPRLFSQRVFFKSLEFRGGR